MAEVLEIMLPRELRTRIIKQMTSQKVEYVQDGTRVQYGLCLYLFVVAWRDSPISKYLNTPPEARHSQRKEQKKGMTRERKWSPPGTIHTKLWPTKAPQNTKNFPQSKPRSKNTKVLSQNPNLAPTKFRTPVLKPTTLTSHPHIQYLTPLISDQCNWMRSTTTKKWISNLTKRFPHNCWHFEFNCLAPSWSQWVRSRHECRVRYDRQ